MALFDHEPIDKESTLPLRRPDELDLEAAAVGGLAVAAAGIVEIEDNFAGETDHIVRKAAVTVRSNLSTASHTPPHPILRSSRRSLPFRDGMRGTH